MSLSDLVERTCLRVWSMWHIAVVGDLDRYFLTTSVVRPVQDWKERLFISLIHVEGEGINSVTCRNATKSGSYLV